MNTNTALAVLGIMSILAAIQCYSLNQDIAGLTTRVNLLEARIHWQEEPPK